MSYSIDRSCDIKLATKPTATNENHSPISSTNTTPTKNNPPDSSSTTLSPLEESIEAALKANRELQRAFLQKLEKVEREKQINRQKVMYALDTVAKNLDFIGEASNQQMKKSYVENHEKIPDFKRKHRDWGYNEDNKWKRRFFIDPDGFIPSPYENEDIIKRRLLEGDQEHNPHYLHEVLWTDEDLGKLKEIVESRSDSEGGNGVDFMKVAEVLNKDLKIAHKKHRHNLPFVSRSASDCELKYKNTICKQKEESNVTVDENKDWTKEETLKILELVHLSQQSSTNKTHENLWQYIAEKVTSLGISNRSAWQCFRYHQSTLSINQRKNRPWLLEEDELLFKIIAAKGPQCVLGIEELRDISRKFFADKNYNQIRTRLMESMLNPYLDGGIWSEEDTKKLLLAIKVYGDDSAGLFKIAKAHFPSRETRRVNEKWNRYLNPKYDTSPLTKEEVEILHKTIYEELNHRWDNSVIAEKFPTRNPSALYNHYLYSADTDVNDLKMILENAYMKRNGIDVNTNNNMIEQNMTEEGSGTRSCSSSRKRHLLLHKDDFVLRVKKKRK